MTPLYWCLLVIAIQRLAELAYARRNTLRLLDAGGIEYGAAHYPLIVVLHAGWLLAMALAIPADAAVRWPALGLWLALQPLRYWTIATLGERWTTRVIVLPGLPQVAGGPFRFARHPNYAVVAAEIVLLPAAFGAWEIAVAFGVANAVLLGVRIRVEDAALARHAQGV